MTEDIAFVGTTGFFDNYSKTNPGDKVENMQKWCSDTWDTWQSTDDFWYAVDRSVIEVPTPSGNDTCERTKESQQWLENNYDDYSFYDAIVVLDYWGGYGLGYSSAIGGAGHYNDKVSLVDMKEEDSGNLPGFFSEVKSEGIAFHEVGHLYCARHTDCRLRINTYESTCEATLLRNPSESTKFCDNDCYDNDAAYQVRSVYDCASKTIDCYVNANKIPSDCSECNPDFTDYC